MGRRFRRSVFVRRSNDCSTTPRRALIGLVNRATIDMVVVDGHVLIEAGTFKGGDEARITAAGSAAIQKTWDLPEARAAFQG